MIRHANTLFIMVEYVDKIASAFCLYISRRDFTWIQIKKMRVRSQIVGAPHELVLRYDIMDFLGDQCKGSMEVVRGSFGDCAPPLCYGPTKFGIPINMLCMLGFRDSIN